MLQQRVYCSGLWLIPGNKKRSFDHYIKLLPRTLDMIAGHHLRFYSDDQPTLDMVATLCQTRGIVFEQVFKRTDELPGWDMSEDFLKACIRMKLDEFSPPKSFSKEKGVKHYWRDMKGSGEDVYRGILSVWLSKVALAESMAAELSGNPMVCWLDASVSRFNNRRRNWDFRKVSTPMGKVSHYRTGMRCYGAKLPLNASFLCADSPTWTKLLLAFNATASRAAKMPYGHDEETVLADCVRTLPHLFHCISAEKQIALAWHQRALRFIRNDLTYSWFPR